MTYAYFRVDDQKQTEPVSAVDQLIVMTYNVYTCAYQPGSREA